MSDSSRNATIDPFEIAIPADLYHSYPEQLDRHELMVYQQPRPH